MERFVARQPIFTAKKEVFAYELLFRSGLGNYFDGTDGDQASSNVIADSFLLFGVEEMTGQARAFINFTRRLIVEGYATALPREWVVVEILETVEPDEQVVAACRDLKKRGYTLALDDFVYQEKFRPLVDLADIVKVDFMVSPPKERRELAEFLLPKGITLLAEKVETQEEFDEGVDLGYTYFQGYFFSKPVIVSRKDVPTFKMHFLRILKAINQPEVDFREVARVIESEVTISFKLLRYLNSAAFGLRNPVKDVKQALTLLGENEIRKWTNLLAMTNMASDRPVELVVHSLIRARFCELIAPAAGYGERKNELFMMGLFSLLDAVIGRPIKEILEDVPLAEDLRAALCQGEGRLKSILDLYTAIDRAMWPEVEKFTKQLGLDDGAAAEAYIEAVQFPQAVFFAEPASAEP